MSKYLKKINTPEDIKKLSYHELDILCSEIRSNLIKCVSKTGGHLASNLGVVELTVALHRVLNTPNDKVVWDVGHQTYVHKMLTGRFSKMNTIRHEGGLCGFCNPIESEYDVSYTGHASASLSTALGMAEARRNLNEKFEVTAVIGDGALSGGLAIEAMNNIGNNKPKMMIVLNDNEMSIAKNVGAFSTYLAKARTNPKYTGLKHRVTSMINNLPDGDGIYIGLKKFKNKLKSILTPNLFFEQLGITYLGPVDGHNIKDMEEMFNRALSLNEPVLVHVITKKGRGYAPAEKNPQLYHGVGAFDVENGSSSDLTPSFSSEFGDELCCLAKENKNIVVVTPAMIPGSGLIMFMEKYPKRLYDVGIAEGHAVTFAAGLSIAGSIPVVAIYSTFLQRAYDNVIHDVAIGNNHVVFAVDRAGLVPGDGVTHQGVFDISYLSAIPNMTILAPSSFSELRKMLNYAVNQHRGPIAIRYPRGGEVMKIDNGYFELSKASVVKDGNDITIAAEGRLVAKAQIAAGLLKQRGIDAAVIDVRTIKPIDYDTIFASAKRTKRLYTLEENVFHGGMGEALCSEAKLRNTKFEICVHALPDEFISHGTEIELNLKYRFTPEQIAGDIERMINS